MLLPLTQYTVCLQEERDRTDLQTGKAAQLKADMIVSFLRKEFTLLHLIKHKLPTGAGFHILTEAFVEVEGFSAMPEQAADNQQRCTQFTSQYASSSANVPPPESTTASTLPHL